MTPYEFMHSVIQPPPPALCHKCKFATLHCKSLRRRNSKLTLSFLHTILKLHMLKSVEWKVGLSIKVQELRKCKQPRVRPYLPAGAEKYRPHTVSMAWRMKFLISVGLALRDPVGADQ